MNRSTVLLATADLAVTRFDHPPDQVHVDPEREVAEGWGIAFVESGRFELTVADRHHRLGAGSVLLTWPGLAFSCRHGEACPADVCLAVRFADPAVAGEYDAWAGAGWAGRRRAPPRLAHVRRRLSTAVSEGQPSDIERWGIAALLALAADARPRRVRGPYAARRRDLDGVIAACRAIELDPGIDWSVADQAREVGLTSPRLTRAFARYLGVSPHQYLVRWRLVAAAERLDAGGTVSDTCYAVGFRNLSHFIRSFRRTLGVRPSDWRRQPSREKRRKVQALRTGDSYLVASTFWRRP